MQAISQFSNYVRYAVSSKLLVGMLFVTLTGVALGGTMLNNVPASAETCKTNNIMPCGASSLNDFVAKYKQNKVGDLDTVFGAYGLSHNEIDRFSRTARTGLAYKNGNITVDGKLVATGAVNLGRDNKPNSTPVNIAGKTYYAQRNQDTFVADSIPIFVMMNGEQFEFGALTICGNPIKARPTGKAPAYSCDMLSTKQINRTTFSYTTKVTAMHGTKLAKLVYEFGDGTSKTTTNPDEVVTHTYAKEGSYTTKVTVHVAVNGETKTVTSAACAKPVEVKAVPPTPVYTCNQLVATTINKQNRQYRFTAKTSQSGGATLKDASFDFGDKQSVNGVKPSDANTVSAEHTYAQAGTYAIVATVNFSVAGNVKSATCQTQITPEEQPPAECKPGIPVGDNRCVETPPQVPANLPDTGAANILGGAIGATSIVGAGSYFLRSRRLLLRSIWRR